MRRSALLVAAFAAIAAFGSCAADSAVDDGPDDDPDTTSTAPKALSIAFGSVTMRAELATTLAEREKGLMDRPALPDTAGMLFVFGRDQILSFWMKDTPVNLSIAFLDSNKTILNIREMMAFDETTLHRSTGLARYAIEARQGWFADHGIVAGAKATFTLPSGLVIDP
jgi:uncharacterized membrane protein (UPF0127 family)